MRVLVVEDDVALLDAMREVLEDEGFEVALAENGQVALAALRSGSPPCAIVLDLMMPVMTGWEFRSEQRRDPRLASIPTVVVSAFLAGPDTAELAADAYLRKPVKPEDLVLLLRLHCSRARLRAVHGKAGGDGGGPA